MTLREFFLSIKVNPATDVFVGFPDPNGPAFTALGQETVDYLLDTEIPSDILLKEVLYQNNKGDN